MKRIIINSNIGYIKNILLKIHKNLSDIVIILMEERVKKIIEKYSEFILFSLVGVFTSIINYLLYYIFCYTFSVNYLLSNVISWGIAVLFSFVVNKYWIFKNSETKGFLKELCLFVYGRIFTLVIEMILLFICVDVGGFNDLISKFIIDFFTAVLNYFIGKLYVFREGRK